MTTFSRASTALLTLSLLSSLTACDVVGEKRSINADDSILAAYFFSDQYAVNHTELRDFLSFFYGAVIAAAPTSNMDLWTNPPETGCFITASYSSVASQEVGIRRIIDAGSVSLQTPDTQITALTKDKEMNYSRPLGLTPGTHKLISPGMKNGALAYEQDFEVPEKGGDIVVYSYLDSSNPTQETAQPLASPIIPASSDPTYKVIFNRLSLNVIGANAPAGTNYVRVRLRDGSNSSGGDVTCFALPGQPVMIEPGVLYGFRTGVQGYMELDFVRTSKVTDIGKLKWSNIVSSMRHFQGTFEFYDTDGIKVTANVGLVEFR